MDNFDACYSLFGYSEKYLFENSSYRILYYNHNDNFQENRFLDLMKNILENGQERTDRTGTGTISTFGNKLHFDISSSIPLMTTKFVPFRVIVEELLFTCRGDTDVKILQKKGIKIWDGNSSREFLDNRGLTHYPEGILGPVYGYLWRFFGASYSPEFADTSKIDTNIIGGYDQLKNVENLLKNDPFSRRIIISAWAPHQMDQMALPPCHVLIQFYVSEENNERYLSCIFTMRSSDFDTASCYNIINYTLLTYILAKRHNMKPKEIIYIAGDTHIYKNHIDQVKLQMTRTPRPFPCVELTESIKTKDWSEMNVNDFNLIGYFPHPTIKINMAI